MKKYIRIIIIVVLCLMLIFAISIKTNKDAEQILPAESTENSSDATVHEDINTPLDETLPEVNAPSTVSENNMIPEETLTIDIPMEPIQDTQDLSNENAVSSQPMEEPESTIATKPVEQPEAQNGSDVRQSENQLPDVPIG